MCTYINTRCCWFDTRGYDKYPGSSTHVEEVTAALLLLLAPPSSPGTSCAASLRAEDALAAAARALLAEEALLAARLVVRHVAVVHEPFALARAAPLRAHVHAAVPVARRAVLRVTNTRRNRAYIQ